ncbi:MAG: hypothetical protein VB118_02900 [Oscillospiraceae bacterium]|nr:hypothetical protein [Oscillospiraceae bacterium]
MENEENTAYISKLSAENEVKIILEDNIPNSPENDKNHDIFKKTTYWHQQSSDIRKLNIESLLKEMSDCLLRIEAKLNEIETMKENKTV